jgi:hypothetical protein
MLSWSHTESVANQKVSLALARGIPKQPSQPVRSILVFTVPGSRDRHITSGIAAACSQTILVIVQRTSYVLTQKQFTVQYPPIPSKQKIYHIYRYIYIPLAAPG